MNKRQYGTGGVIKLPGSRFWYILYRADGRQIRESSKSESKMVAEKLLQQRMGEHGLGVKPEQDVKNVSYENVRDAWLAGNKQGYSAIAHLNGFFAGKRAIGITADTLRDYIAKRRKEGAADATVRRSLNDLRAMLYQARKEGKLRQADIPFFPMSSLKEGKIRKGFVEQKQFDKLKEALPENLRPLIVFLYCTGCRVGAARKITWDMVAKDCSEIALPGEITKSGEPLVLPMAGPGLEEVAATMRKTFRKEGPVFDTTNLRVAWNKACVAAKLGTMNGRLRAGLTIHDLRRSAVRNLIRAGVSRTVAMEISGHKTGHVFDRYNITDTSDVRAALEKAGQHAIGKA